MDELSWGGGEWEMVRRKRRILVWGFTGAVGDGLHGFEGW